MKKKSSRSTSGRKTKTVGSVVVRTRDATGAPGAWVFTPAFLEVAGGQKLVFDVVKGALRIGGDQDYGAGCGIVFRTIIGSEFERK